MLPNHGLNAILFETYFVSTTYKVRKFSKNLDNILIIYLFDVIN